MTITILPPDPVRKSTVGQILDAITRISENIEKTKIKRENEQLMAMLQNIPRTEPDPEIPGGIKQRDPLAIQQEARDRIAEFQKGQKAPGGIFDIFRPSTPSIGTTPVEQAIGAFDVRELFDPETARKRIAAEQIETRRGLSIEKARREEKAAPTAEDIISEREKGIRARDIQRKSQEQQFKIAELTGDQIIAERERIRSEKELQDSLRKIKITQAKINDIDPNDISLERERIRLERELNRETTKVKKATLLTAEEVFAQQDRKVELEELRIDATKALLGQREVIKKSPITQTQLEDVTKDFNKIYADIRDAQDGRLSKTELANLRKDKVALNGLKAELRNIFDALPLRQWNLFKLKFKSMKVKGKDFDKIDADFLSELFEEIEAESAAEVKAAAKAKIAKRQGKTNRPNDVIPIQKTGMEDNTVLRKDLQKALDAGWTIK